MKKRIFCFILLILLFSLFAVPAAFADSWFSLGTWNIGDEVSYQLTAYAFYDEKDEITVSGDIPPGCTIERSSNEEPYGLLLNGVVTTSGSYDFQITINGEVNTFNLTVAPESPVINIISAPTSCDLGSTTVLSVGASNTDGGTLSYQWYRNGEAVFGGTDSSISIATTSPGVFNFYCVVTNTLNGLTSTATSETISVDIESAINGIAVSTQPSKIAYNVGDTLDTSGLVLKVFYEDGNSAEVSDGYTVSPTVLTDAGTKTIVVTYGNQVCSFQVEVKSATAQRTLSVVTMPNKTSYTAGDTLDTSGLQLCVSDGNNKSYIQSGFSCSPSTLSSEGTERITVFYDNLVCYFNVSVKAKQTSQLAIEKLPDKTTYLVGESLDIAGLTIKEISGSDSADTRTITSGFTTEPSILTKAGQQTVTVSYDNLTTTFTVDVSETATPAPTEVLPAQDAAAQAAAAAANAAQNARSQKSSRTGLILFITIVAILALVILGVYVYLAKAENIEDTKLGKLIQRLMDKMSR